MNTGIRAALCVATLSLAAVGCASSSDKKAPTSTGFETAPPGWSLGHPASVTPEPDGPGSLQKTLFGDDDKETEERIARLERQLIEAQVKKEQGANPALSTLPPANARPIAKIGVVATDIDAAVLEHLQRALHSLAPGYAATVMTTADLAPHLEGYGCSVQAIDACLERLAVYPGVQAVAVLRAGPAAPADTLNLQVSLHSTAHDVSLPTATYRLPTAGGKTPAASSEGLAADLLQKTTRLTKIAPWSTRAFNQDAEQWFIAAGQRSGLQIGDTLEIRGSGRLIKSPTGAAAGWIPGPLKGKLRVTGFLGDDNASAELLEGTPPTQEDHLLFVR